MHSFQTQHCYFCSKKEHYNVIKAGFTVGFTVGFAVHNPSNTIMQVLQHLLKMIQSF